MKETKPDKDFLDDLYEMTKSQKSPAQLDSKILEQARQEIESSAPISLFQWQRVTSVAAVMVLTIFIFFDVKDQYEKDLNLELLEAPAMQAAPAAKQSPSAEMAFDVMEEDQVEQDAPLPKTPAMNYEELSVSSKKQSSESSVIEQSDEQKSYEQVIPRIISTSEPSMRSKAKLAESLSEESLTEEPLIQEQSVEELSAVPQFLESQSVDPEYIVSEIRSMLAEGNRDMAQVLYTRLKTEFPEYPVPIDIADALDE